MLYPVGKQAYKVELSKKWRIHDVFHVLLLEKDIARKGRIDDENTAELDDGDKSGEYKMEAIQDSTVYVRESELDYLPGLYYLVSY